MQTRKIIAGAFTAPVSIHLDEMQQTFWSPVRFRLVQHSSETERDLEKGPAVHALKVYRGRLDPVVDLKSEMFIAYPNQGLSYRRGPFPNRQRFPIPGFGLCDQSIELVLSFKDSAARQARSRRERD